MSSQTLAIRWRPRKFNDVCGNILTIDILRNSITLNKLRSAYFFAGGKGSGKTSTARIFAKAINCENRAESDPEPCCHCIQCTEADRDVLMGDIMEIDAASQNSVASIKALIGQIQYPPMSAKKRIVILDEVHMLSNAASNALLKTLEEPPDHVIFIFATTDPQKVIETVRSRALYFEFQRLTTDDIANRLIYIAKQESITLDPDAAHLLGVSVNGAMRDAITVLDQASILSNHVTHDTVARIIGHVSTEKLYDLFSKVHASSDSGAQQWLMEMNDKLEQDIITSILTFIETLLLINAGVDISRRIPQDSADKIKKLSQVFTMHQLFSMGDLARETLLDYRRLSLRDSRALLRLLVAGLILAKEDRHKDSPTSRQSIHSLVSNGRNVNLDTVALLRKMFSATEVELVTDEPQ